MSRSPQDEWGGRVYTIKDRINEIRLAIQNKMYQSALALALTLPDICGQVKYPQEKCKGRRYRDWFNEFVGHLYMPKVTAESIDPNHRIVNGNVCWNLRCAFLHSGDDDIADAGLKAILGPEDDGFSVSCNFLLDLDWEELDCSTDFSAMTRNYTIRINIVYLCDNLCDAADNFFDNCANNSTFEERSFSIYSSDQWEKDRKLYFCE